MIISKDSSAEIDIAINSPQLLVRTPYSACRICKIRRERRAPPRAKRFLVFALGSDFEKSLYARPCWRFKIAHSFWLKKKAGAQARASQACRRKIYPHDASAIGKSRLFAKNPEASSWKGFNSGRPEIFGRGCENLQVIEWQM